MFYIPLVVVVVIQVVRASMHTRLRPTYTQVPFGAGTILGPLPKMIIQAAL